MAKSSFDVIVVGGGSAGCVMASRLSENPDCSVLLIEAGPDYGSYDLGKWPSDLLDANNLALDSHSWGFEDGNAARGRVLGGCSSINACLVAMAPPGDYDRWAKMQNDGWGFAQQWPHIQKVESMVKTRVPSIESLSWFVEPFMQGCEQVGYPKLSYLNGPEWTSGVATAPRNVFDGVRWSAAFAYLDLARNRSNLTILSERIVDRVLFKNGNVIGVAVAGAQGASEIFADTVVLSAGAYMSPTILQRSGIGPSRLLENLGIKVISNLNGVGRDLGDHSGASIQYEMDAISHLPTNGLPEVILHTRSSVANDQYWDSQTIIWHSGDKETSTLNFAVHAMESDSKGSVQALSVDPNVLPAINQPWGKLSSHDLALLVESIEVVRAISATGVFGSGLGKELSPTLQTNLGEWIPRNTGGYWHPSGTCKMGASPDEGAVVDSRGRVYGINGLRVVDASIFPTVPRSNPNIPTMAAAEFISATMQTN